MATPEARMVVPPLVVEHPYLKEVVLEDPYAAEVAADTMAKLDAWRPRELIQSGLQPQDIAKEVGVSVGFLPREACTTKGLGTSLNHPPGTI